MRFLYAKLELQELMSSDTKMDLIRKARQLAIFTIAYNLVEAAVSVFFGAAEESLALLGFGVDALVECLSAALVLWRFNREFIPTSKEDENHREEKASKAIGGLFILLSISIVLGSANALWRHQAPETTLPGLIISLLSLSFMYWLYRSKMKIGQKLDSRVIVQDAKCSLACMQLSVILFIGSLLFAIQPKLWWVDSTAALVLAFFIAKEGWEALSSSETGCGCSSAG